MWSRRVMLLLATLLIVEAPVEEVSSRSVTGRFNLWLHTSLFTGRLQSKVQR